MLRVDKKIVGSMILALSLAQVQAKEVAVYAKEVHQEHGNIVSNDGVVVEYEGSIFKAQSAKYSKNNNTLLLQGNVTVIEQSGKRIRAKELTVNLDTNHAVFKDFFTMNRDHVWISSKDGEKKDDVIVAQNALFSSCGVDNPDWMLGFDKAIYDLKNKEIRFYNAKVYVKKVPVFYFPYFYLSLEHERKTGFLSPKFSISGKSGYVYKQPFFWNINQSQDLEIDPVVMSKRGYGASMTYRFYHEKDAFGTIRIGYYKDKKSFVQKENLIHDKHFGVEANYVNGSVFDSLSKNDYENKFYLNATNFNDGDFFNLSDSALSHYRIGSYYDSKLNYYIKKENAFYLGLTSDYYKSTVKANNDDTIQVLPQLQFHLPFAATPIPNLYYSFDVTNANLTRKNGSKAAKSVFKAPLYAHFSLFNSYLNIDFSEELQASFYRFTNVALKNKKYERVSLNHAATISTDLTKVYDSGIHTVMLSAVYTKSNKLSESWMKYSEIPADLKEDFVDDLAYKNQIALRAHEIWKSNSGVFTIDHILESNYNWDNNRWDRLGNTLGLNYKNWSFYSYLDYSLEAKKFTEIHNQIAYDGDKLGISLGYLWNKDSDFKTLTKQLQLRTSYKYSNQLKFSAGADYDLKEKSLRSWGVSTDYSHKCWAVNVGFGQDIRPVLKTSGEGSIKNNYVSFTFTILPFGISYGN